MKTSRFENTIRRKLESIEPDFQEQDWVSMQRYMKAHTPPTFLQQYGSWIGYAAAASVTTVMALMYAQQLSQNETLLSDVKNLKGQIEVIRNQPAAPAIKTDTIYIVQSVPSAPELSTPRSSATGPHQQFQERDELAVLENRAKRKNSRKTAVPLSGITELTRTQSEISEDADRTHLNAGSVPITNSMTTSGEPAQNITRNDFGILEPQELYVSEHAASLERKMNFGLANRLSGRQFRKDMGIISTPQLAKSAQPFESEKVTKPENVIPQFNIKAPYRIGGGIQFQGNGQAKTVVGEVLLAKKRLSISTGVSWLKVKSMEFMSEKIFREKNQKDFKKTHPNEVPYALDVFNIKVNPTIVQIPLTVAFRSNLKDDWAYSIGAGTNLSVTSREEISFDCRAPNKEYFKKSFDKKTDTPAFGSMNFSLGIEKTWHPIVIQAEGYLYTYFKPLTPLSSGAGPGVRFKLLYQIGGKM